MQRVVSDERAPALCGALPSQLPPPPRHRHGGRSTTHPDAGSSDRLASNDARILDDSRLKISRSTAQLSSVRRDLRYLQQVRGGCVGLGRVAGGAGREPLEVAAAAVVSVTQGGRRPQPPAAGARSLCGCAPSIRSVPQRRRRPADAACRLSWRPRRAQPSRRETHILVTRCLCDSSTTLRYAAATSWKVRFMVAGGGRC